MDGKIALGDGRTARLDGGAASGPALRGWRHCRLESLDCRYAKALAAPGHSRRTASKTDRAFSSDGTPDANQTVNKNRAAARVDR